MNLHLAADHSEAVSPWRRPPATRPTAAGVAAAGVAAAGVAAAQGSATGLLVSVRNLAEALDIDSLAVDVIDLKEPRRGPLGACDPDIWHRCLAECPFTGAWSAALGEADAAIALASEVPPGFSFAKAGPAGIDRRERLVGLWDNLRRKMPSAVELVAVAYADWSAARTLPPEQVLEAATDTGLRTLLIDTFAKEGRSSLEHLTFARLQALVTRAEEAECEVVIAGGVAFDTLATFARLGVRRVGVRGGVCQGSRESRIDPAAVALWAQQLARLARDRSETISEPPTP